MRRLIARRIDRNSLSAESPADIVILVEFEMKYVPTDAIALPKPAMPDVAAWIATLQRFVAHVRRMVADGLESGALDNDDAEEFETVLTVAPPADVTDAFTAALLEKLPTSLRDFFVGASAEISFRYAYYVGDNATDGVPSWVRGGEMASIPDPIFSLAKLAEYWTDANNYADNSGIADFPEDQAVWKRSLPFFRYNNSNFLALDPIIDSDDPFVIFLDHEGEPKLIARNLAAFLTEWPRVCYVGPGDFYDLEAFIDSKTGVLSGDTHSAIGLRDVLKWSASM